MKLICAAVMVLAFLLPLLPVIARFAMGGFVISQISSVSCIPKNGFVSYYFFNIPLSIMTAIGAALLIYIIASLCKVNPYQIIAVICA